MMLLFLLASLLFQLTFSLFRFSYFLLCYFSSSSTLSQCYHYGIGTCRQMMIKQVPVSNYHSIQLLVEKLNYLAFSFAVFFLLVQDIHGHILAKHYTNYVWFGQEVDGML